MKDIVTIVQCCCLRQDVSRYCQFGMDVSLFTSVVHS